jgi:hypothetical protein
MLSSSDADSEHHSKQGPERQDEDNGGQKAEDGVQVTAQDDNSGQDHTDDL